jgi:hypothetical protein
MVTTAKRERDTERSEARPVWCPTVHALSRTGLEVVDNTFLLPVDPLIFERQNCDGQANFELILSFDRYFRNKPR